MYRKTRTLGDLVVKSKLSPSIGYTVVTIKVFLIMEIIIIPSLEPHQILNTEEKHDTCFVYTIDL